MNTDDVLTHSSGVEKAKGGASRADGFNRHDCFFGRQMGSGERAWGGAMWAARQRATTIVKEEGKRGARGCEGSSQGEVFPELGKYSLCYSNCSPNTCKGARGDAGEQRTRPRETFRL